MRGLRGAGVLLQRTDPGEAVGIAIRRATEKDDAFLRRLHRLAMGPHVEAVWGAWDDEDQAGHFAKAPLKQHDLVVLDGRPIGCLLVLDEADALVLSRIWLLPEHQNRGIGARLVTQLCEQAAREGLPVRLRVLKVNPAHRLYRRLGFSVTHESETHYSMERAVR